MTLTKFLLPITILLLFVGGCAREETGTVTAFCGSASKPALEEAAATFEQETGIRVYLNFGGSGTMLSQMKLGKSGDIYLPASPDYMSLAEKDGIVAPDSMTIVAYLIPVILVPAGNPKNIKTLADLARPGVTVAIGNPEAVSIGRYAVEILERNDLLDEVAPNIVTLAENVSKLASLVALKSVDAVLAWHVSAIDLDTVEIIYLEPEQIPRLSYISGAVTRFALNVASSQKFLDFLVSPQGQDIFRKWGYITTESEARKFAPGAWIGGEYRLPADYQSLLK
ncbi:MAG: molybdate ABC transporter substrate-binding protein [Chloroflexi bacterium RBG_16_50_9]|nr:MAG: molybdate ABC transporter substrate-binding protein [Chloroflexi bacterium RBG_16_50_9]